jgi:hypothetical protein
LSGFRALAAQNFGVIKVKCMARQANITSIAVGRILALLKFKYALKSGRKFQLLRGARVRSFSIVTRDEGFEAG